MKKEYNFSKMKKVKHQTATRITKVAISIRLDLDLVTWLKDEADRQGLAYQTLINFILKNYMHGGGVLLGEKAIRILIKEELKKTGTDNK